jgi:hypothetical protein
LRIPTGRRTGSGISRDIDETRHEKKQKDSCDNLRVLASSSVRFFLAFSEWVGAARETESKEQNCDGGRCEHALHCARGSSKDRLCAPTRPDTSEKRGVVCFRVRRVASAMQKKTEERRLLASLVANPASRAAFCHRPTGRSATAGLPSARLTNRGRACSFGSRARHAQRVAGHNAIPEVAEVGADTNRGKNGRGQVWHDRPCR